MTWLKDRPDARTALGKKARRGLRGYPVATIYYYGPTDQVATKVAVGIVPHAEGEVADIERWRSEGEIRSDQQVASQILAFVARHAAKTVVMPDRIVGCPHEEEVDYPAGTDCPLCPYWAGRDRWSGVKLATG